MNTVISDESRFITLCANNMYLPEKSWLIHFQKNKLTAFLYRGLPTRREELWKYTDVSSLSKQTFDWAQNIAPAQIETEINAVRLVFVNGYYSEKLSDLSLLPKEVILCPLSQAIIKHEELIQDYLLTEFHLQNHPFANMNTALMTDGIFLFVPQNVSVAVPIHCIYLGYQQNNFIINPRNVIQAGANSQVTFIEEYRAENATNYFTNVVTSVCSDAGSCVNYYKIQNENLSATHIANVFVTLKKDSTFNSFGLSVGSRLGREDLKVIEQEPGATCNLQGFYHLTTDNQHIDNHLHVDHAAPQGVSSMEYKGILAKKSHAVFNGKVYVHKHAQQINAQQANHNLLLSNDAEIDTKPELEIYADNVKCAHGATVGQLDNESLFYLRARGIDVESAKTMLTRAFAVEVFNKIENHLIRQYILKQAGHYDE